MQTQTGHAARQPLGHWAPTGAWPVRLWGDWARQRPCSSSLRALSTEGDTAFGTTDTGHLRGHDPCSSEGTEHHILLQEAHIAPGMRMLPVELLFDGDFSGVHIFVRACRQYFTTYFIMYKFNWGMYVQSGVKVHLTHKMNNFGSSVVCPTLRANTTLAFL